MKILRRPTETEAGLSAASSVETESDQHKTYAQREAEYASARYIATVIYCSLHGHIKCTTCSLDHIIVPSFFMAYTERAL